MAQSRGSYSSKPKDNSGMDLKDMFGFITDAIMKQATEPNLHAYKPHAKQKIFHESDAQGRLYIGGNRSGKTYGAVVEDLWYVTGRHPFAENIPAPVRGRVLGDGFDNGTIDQALIPAFKRWIIPSDLINGSWEDSWTEREKKLTFENGSFIEFKSYAQDIQKHAGTSRHFIHFDEEPPQNIYIENLLRLLDTNGRWWMSMTPLNGMNWVYDELFLPSLEGKTKNIDVIEVSTTDNPYITQGAMDNLLQGLDQADLDQRIEGKFAEKGGLVFPEFGEMHYLDGPDWNDWWPSEDWTVYCSVDHGVNNPTAILWHAVSPNNEVVTFGEYYKSNKIVRDHANFIKEFEAKNGIKPMIRPGDPAMKQRNGVTGTSIVEAYAEEGIYLAVETIPRSVAPGVDKMRKYLRMGSQGVPHWRIIKNRCPNLIKEMKRLHWQTYSSSKLNDSLNKKQEIHKKDDHAFDSSRYFFTLMPDLAINKLWHITEPEKKGRAPQSYWDTLVEMSEYSQEKAWRPTLSGRGFASEEYTFANLEG